MIKGRTEEEEEEEAVEQLHRVQSKPPQLPKTPEYFRDTSCSGSH